ncbi:MAG TPA: (E)-4-hydroxy-3-methylbut-2-enyl-diphosphate synthase [Atribacteraceae bacterium]|nr:(E)-4-hydroxy-3-methylbut-2-enyl-diphosphate synthase [Atribacteraceae bacterium]
MKRQDTHVVALGNITVGGESPVSIEAMGRSHPAHIQKTLREIRRSVREGCEIFRLAVPDREALEGLKILHPKSPLPLIADIHFIPELAWDAVRAGIDGVRINPGTFRNQEKYINLVEMLKDSQTVLRLGANAGSLPAALQKESRVKALFEIIATYLEVPRKKNFHRVILSAKSSDIEETIETNHLLSEAFPYPLHIGLTEAGEGEEGIIKSTLGVGILLREEIGNTIRISLTSNDPVLETRAASILLKTLGLKNEGIEIISCPTCARKMGDVVSLVRILKKKLARYKVNRNIRIAVMGCEVNGPGEAREADFGLALAKGTAVLFSHGKVIGTVHRDRAIDVFLDHFNTFFPAGEPRCRE